MLRFTGSRTLKWLIWDGGSNGSVSSSSSISLNTWSHIAITHDNSTNSSKFYINGSLDASATSLSKSISGNPLMSMLVGMVNRVINFSQVKLMKSVFGIIFYRSSDTG